MRRIAVALIAFSSLSCSAAGFKGYGPKGDKFIGSAAGYTDARISERTFFVSYTDGSIDKAVPKFHRRAAELCASLGLASYDVTSSAPGKEVVPRFTSTAFGIPLQSPDGLPMYSGYVTCKAEGAPNVAMSSGPAPVSADPTPQSAIVQLVEALTKSADQSAPSAASATPDDSPRSLPGRQPTGGTARGARPAEPSAPRADPGTQPQPSTSQPLARTSGANAVSRSGARIMFYLSSTEFGAVNVFLDDMVQGGLISSFAGEPSCGAAGAITLRVKPGRHKLYAEAAGRRATWGPMTHTIADGECVAWDLSARSATPAAMATRRPGGINRPEMATLGVWTRRDARDIHLTLNGFIGPATRTYIHNRAPTECGDIGVASREYERGTRVVLEVRRSTSFTAPVVLRREFVLDRPCTLFELQ